MNNSDDGVFWLIGWAVWSTICFALGGVGMAYGWHKELSACAENHNVFSCEWVTQPKTNQSAK